MEKSITVSELLALVEGELLSGEAEGSFSNLAALKDAGPSDISFFGNDLYLPEVKSTSAGAVLVAPDFKESLDSDSVRLVAVDNPTAAFDRIVETFAPPEPEFQPGIAPSAVVAEGVKLDPTKVRIGPCAVIEAGCQIGEGSTVGAGCFVGENSTLGRDCLIHANASIHDRSVLGDGVILHSGVVIGGDGFGYEFVDGRHKKIAQLGIVRLEDFVEIGANSTIDRARFGETVIGEGTKIDSQVQVGHNAEFGKHCIVVALTGIAGSVKIGDGVVIAAQSGVAGHIEICGGVTLAARSGVTKSITEPGVYMGFPAQPLSKERRMIARSRQLDDLFKSVKKIERSLDNG